MRITNLTSRQTKAGQESDASSSSRANPRGAWWIPAGLIGLSLIPALAGGFRISELTGGAAVTPSNGRFFDAPLPVLAHIVSATIFTFLGAFQFVPSLRRPQKGTQGWHRVSGSILLPAGVLVALSGLWMTLFYALPPSDGTLLYFVRLTFGAGMLASLLLGAGAIARRDFIGHGAWMKRAYAIALGAGSQAILLAIPELISGPPDVTTRALLMGAAWIINLAVAEYTIQRRQHRRIPDRAKPMTHSPQQRTAQ